MKESKTQETWKLIHTTPSKWHLAQRFTNKQLGGAVKNLCDKDEKLFREGNMLCYGEDVQKRKGWKTNLFYSI